MKGSSRPTQKTEFTMPLGLGTGTLICIIITLAGAMLIATLVNGERISEEAIPYGVMILVLAASVSGAAVSAFCVKKSYLVVCLLTGICYFAVLLATTALFFGGEYRGIGATAAIILAGSGGTALISAKGKPNGKTKHKVKNFR